MANLRSLLFVPGDSERKIAKGLDSGADALILDLEDAVAPARKPEARRICRDALARAAAGPLLFVRINPLDSDHAAEDLAAVMAGRPFGIVAPKCQSARDLRRLDDMLVVLEAREGIQRGSTRLLPIVTETGASMLGLSSYAEAVTPRLFGMMWGAEDLAADLGARTNRDSSGAYALPYQHARAGCLYAAAAAGCLAVDAVYTDFRDLTGLETEAVAAAQSGFSAKAAIHPAQVAVINGAFLPTADEVAQARRVIDAFAASGNAGVAALDGRMLDRPHQRAAERILAATAS